MMTALRLTLTIIALCAAIFGSTSTASADAELEKAAGIFKLYCENCHGPKGDGNGIMTALPVPPRDFTKGDFKYGGSDQDIFDVITDGAASKGGNPIMAPWKFAIPNDADRWLLVKYVRHFKQ